MLKIFAIDPKICQNLEWFRYCTEHCQPSQGRAIADLPYDQWYENAFAIIQDLQLPPVEEKSLKRRLDLVRAQLVKRPGTEWTNWYYDYSSDSFDFSQFSWITEIEKEHRREPFSAVVSPEYEGADNEIKEYHPDELNRTVEAWNTPSGVSITRSPGEFVDAILPMLQIASNIHFLDRYFSVDANSSHTQNYTQMIRDLASYCDSFPSLTIHCCPDENDTPDSGYFENELNKHYAPLIPTGKFVRVLLWQIEQDARIERGAHPFHNRYVLSNHCGVIAGYGTDSAKTATEAPDILQIVDHKIYLELWNQIQDEEFPMIQIEEGNKFVINGTKRP